jgi:glycerol-3-phosphate dehydrogenase
VLRLADRASWLLEPVAEGLPVLGVELLFGVLAEGATCIDDLLARRTRLSLVPAHARAAVPAAEAVLGLGAERLSPR